MEETIGTSGACRVFGKSRATLHRHRNPAPRAEGPRCKPSPHPAELSEEERARVLAVLDSPEFADKSPGQVYTILLDRGVYLGSEASMYRLLRERGQSGERRAQATHPAKKKPELMADGPDQVLVLGHHQTERTRSRYMVPSLRHHRHLLPESHSLGSLAHRERHARERIHRARHRGQRGDHAPGGPRRPRHFDDQQYRRRTLCPARHRPVSFPPARIQRQSVFGGELQDLQVLPRIPRPVRID